MNRKIRILMVAPTLGTYGGIEVFTTRIAKEVALESIFDIRVVFRLRSNEAHLEQIAKELSAIGVSFRIMKRPDWAYFKDLLWADLVNCHFPLVYSTFPAKFLGKKLAITVENRHLPAEHGRLHRLGMRIADARWYISTFVAKTWEHHGLSSRSTIVPAVSELPDAWVAPERRRGFLFIARWVPLKGLEQLIAAYAAAEIDHAQHPLTLLGDGILRSDIELQILATKLEEHISRPGFTSHEEKIQKMSHARWNVAPAAFEEDLGLSPIEARACGVPSIVSDIGGLPEAAGEQGLLCKAGDISTLKSALEEAANMSEEEYLSRSKQAKSSLQSYLPKDGFYKENFLKLLGL